MRGTEFGEDGKDEEFLSVYDAPCRREALGQTAEPDTDQQSMIWNLTLVLGQKALVVQGRPSQVFKTPEGLRVSHYFNKNNTFI